MRILLTPPLLFSLAADSSKTAPDPAATESNSGDKFRPSQRVPTPFDHLHDSALTRRLRGTLLRAREPQEAVPAAAFPEPKRQFRQPAPPSPFAGDPW